MRFLRTDALLGGRILAVGALATAALATAAVTTGAVAAVAAPSPAVSYPLPVKTVSGTNHDTPDPGVLLYNNTFYAFSTGGGLHESSSPTAGGPWTTPADRLAKGTLPGWANGAKGIWAPDMIRTAGENVVFYSAAVVVGEKPAASNDAKAAAARCIGTAES